jgi:serine/threonine-protein kinase
MGSSPVQPGSLLADKYEVRQILGEGGMGVVVEARHVGLDQRVAVKFLLPEVAEHQDAAERFRREARAAVKITSEHVARVIDVGSTDDGIPYMVMEFLHGHDLSDELRSTGPLPIAEAVGWVLQACEAVAEAHAAGIIHRDLKPANLFLHRKADGTRIVKVLDFGISKSIPGGSLDDLALTSTAALIGSPLYMSPEQMHSAKNVDVRTDIWALGAILYQLLTGRPPYVAESLPQLCSALLNDVPPSLNSLRSEVPVGLENVVLGALAKDKAERYPSVAEFASALGEFAPGMLVHAERASRMLSGTDVQFALRTKSGVVTPESVAATTADGPSKSSATTLADVAFRETIGSDHPPDAPGANTLASWGKTGDSGRSTDSPPRRGRYLGAGVAGMLVAGALVAFGVSRTTAEAQSPAAGVAPPGASAKAPGAQQPEVAPTPPPPIDPAKKALEDAGPAESPSKDEIADKPTQVTTAKSPRPAAARPAAKSTPKPAALPTQFGGRR